MSLFYIYTCIIGAACLFAMSRAVWFYRDTFNPLLYLACLLGALYVCLPLYLMHTDGAGILLRYFEEEELEFVQGINCLGVLAILIGTAVGCGSRPVSAQTRTAMLPARDADRVRGAATLVGLLGCAVFAVVRPSVGGWAESGYLRDAYLLTIPALLGLMAAFRHRKVPASGWFLVVLFLVPLATLGALTGRRGPTFMIVTGLAVGWYFMRGTRPALRTILGGGALLGILLLTLVANRDLLMRGDFTFKESTSSAVGAGEGNEFIYGGGQVITFRNNGDFSWCRQYIVDFIVRPIPHEIWPSKYEDAWRMLDLKNLFIEGPGYYFEVSKGWKGTLGAAPGIVADLWWEFSWFFVFAGAGIGWLYGRTWRNAVVTGGPYIAAFGIITSLSLYLVWQAVEAFGFRFMVMVAANYFIWSRVRPAPARGARPLPQPMRMPPVGPRPVVRPQ